jgi:hypothetical protein
MYGNGWKWMESRWMELKEVEKELKSEEKGGEAL